MDTSNDIDNSVITNVISNMHKMVSNRGFDMSNVNRYPAQDHFSKAIDEFKSGRNSLDLYIENTDSSKENYGKKLYVHLMMNMQNIKKPNEIEKLYNMIESSHDLNNNDHVVIIIFHDLPESVVNLEMKYPNLTVFSHKKLLFNLIEHEYVPEHVLLSPSEKVALLSDLMISSYDKLPLISKTDAVCRYYNFRIGDVIKITRPSLAGKVHVMYRYVQDIIH